MDTAERAKQVWEDSFAEQIARQAYNTAPVEAVIRTVAYHLRELAGRGAGRPGPLHFLEVGCGAGANLLWLAQKGITVSGIDVAPTALRLARATLERGGFGAQIDRLVEGSASKVPLPDACVDGIVEACVFQHLERGDREAAFREVGRLLRPGGVFVGYMLATDHTVYRARRGEELADDPGSLVLADGTSRLHLTNIGLSHFFAREEYHRLLAGFRVVDPCPTTYALPRGEAARRGYAEYVQAMWTVFAVK